MKRDFLKGTSGQGKNKAVLYSVLFVAMIVLLTIGVISYGEAINEEVQNSTLSLEEMTSILEETESANSSIGKEIDEVMSEIEIGEALEEIVSEEKIEEVVEVKPVVEAPIEEPVVKKELSFEMPVIGELLRGFAKESLVFSETLQEWVTHLGIDILAPKTTVVKSAEAGVIKSIKNDPRYGLTVVIEHNEEYQSVYSNLLTAEFIVEGETVEKGQSVGTVGNSAAFEIADDPHLHFEVWKNNEAIDPFTVLN